MIVIHCAATKETSNVSVEQIDAAHKVRGFKRPIQSEELKYIGYHYYIRRDGTVNFGRQETEQGAHCYGCNSHSIGICYEGGLDRNGKAKDTRTQAQKASLLELLESICHRLPIKKIIGHRDTSPDKNGNGVIDPFERIKECPCFDAIPEYKHLIKR